MSEDIYQALAELRTGYLEAAAGCGKTEAIVRAVGQYAEGRQLILTHTNAGVAALKARFKNHDVGSEKYHIETISSWAWSWVSKYPVTSQYSGNHPPLGNDWRQIYFNAQNLVSENFVRYVIKNSYTGIIVDEYQDCTQSMHCLIQSLNKIIPCRVLGDPLQGIFDFNKADPLINWQDVTDEFKYKIGELTEPHRWIEHGDSSLGFWAISHRHLFEKPNRPNLVGSPINIKQTNPKNRAKDLISLVRQIEGSVCIIGAKPGMAFQGAFATTMINHGFKMLEANQLPLVRETIEQLESEITLSEKGAIALGFLKKCFSGFSSNGHSQFIEKILMGTNQKTRREDRKLLTAKHLNGFSHQLLYDLIEYLDFNGIICQKTESIQFYKRVVERHLELGEGLRSLFEKEISNRKYSSNRMVKRALGTTLLVKGLEFDHSVILYNGKAWGTNKDLYVAITRGCKSVYFVDETS